MRTLCCIIIVVFTSIIPVFAGDCINNKCDCIGTKIEVSLLDKKYDNRDVLATDLGLWYNFNNVFDSSITLRPYTNIKTWAARNGFIGNPFRDTYFIGGKMEWNNLSINLDHYCEHSVTSSTKVANWNVIKSKPYNFTFYQAAGSNLTKTTLTYLFTTNNFNMETKVGRTLTTQSFYYGTNIRYTYTINRFNIFTDIDILRWNTTKRNVLTSSLGIQYKGIELKESFYYSSKELSNQEDDHSYDENPLRQKTFITSISYKFN